jgi:hypothetical protein
MRATREVKIRHVGQLVITGYRAFVALLTRSHRYGPDLRLLFLAAAVLIDGHSAFADMVTGTCPPRHIREVILNSTTLYINGQWPVTLVTDTPVANGCSARSIVTRIINFRDLNPAFAQELNKRSIRFDEFRLYRSPPAIAPDISFIPSAPDKRLALPAGIIEDITEQSLKGMPEDPNAGHLAPPNSKYYRLQHRAPDGSLGQPFVVNCGNFGLPSYSRRMCSTTYKYAADIVVLYEFRPNDLTFPQEHYGVTANPIVEPEGFLACDARLTAWIVDMQSRPE